jgi:putative flavoprotein involved in K+ transport
MVEQIDTVVIGAGQAGLAMSAMLRERGIEHLVLERSRVGGRWRSERWDSLRFQFPNWSLQLPGYRYTGADPDGFAGYQDVLRLIEQYAVSSQAPVRENAEVVRLAVDGDQSFRLSVIDGTIRARRVVVATGPFQRPMIPSVAHDLPPSVQQLDPTSYRNPAQLPAGAVLVVGSGASGTQIADELMRAGRDVVLCVSRHRRVPRRFRGRDVYWWLEVMGRFAQTIDSFPERRWPPSTLVTGVDGGYDVDIRRLAEEGMRVVGRVIGAADGVVAMDDSASRILAEADAAFDSFVAGAREYVAQHELAGLTNDDEPAAPPAIAIDGSATIDLRRSGIASVIWATGYSYDYSWIEAPVLDPTGAPRQTRGVTAQPGLYFVGLHWMHTFKSGLLAGVGADAEYIADHITGRGATFTATAYQ